MKMPSLALPRLILQSLILGFLALAIQANAQDDPLKSENKMGETATEPETNPVDTLAVPELGSRHQYYPAVVKNPLTINDFYINRLITAAVKLDILNTLTFFKPKTKEYQKKIQ